jgi:hypothetical protein
MFHATGWSNGHPLPTGAGYGLKVSQLDRDRHFRHEWTGVTLALEGRGRPIEVGLSPSFWRGCSELRSAEIGRWLMANRLAPWPKGVPPRVRVEPLGGSEFRIRL